MPKLGRGSTRQVAGTIVWESLEHGRRIPRLDCGTAKGLLNHAKYYVAGDYREQGLIEQARVVALRLQAAEALQEAAQFVLQPSCQGFMQVFR